MQGHRHRRLAGHVELRGEVQQVIQASTAGLGIAQFAEAGRRLGHDRRHQDVVIGPPCGELPCPAVAPLERRHVLCPADIAPHVHERPGVAFHIGAAHAPVQGLFETGKHDDVLHGHDRAKVLEELVMEQLVRRRVADVVSEALEQLPGVGDGTAAFGVHRSPIRMRAQPDPQRLRLAPGCGLERGCRRRRPVGVAGPRSADAVEHPGAVAHAAADDTVDAPAGPAVARVWTQRHAPPVRLQPEQPAVGGGHADGAAPVVGVGDGHDASGHCGSRSSAGATGRVGGIPGIGRRSVGQRLSGDGQAELGRVGPPEIHEPQIGEHRGEVRGARCDMPCLFERSVACVVRLTFGRARQVLGEEWNACQRAARLSCVACGVEAHSRTMGALVEPADDGVDLGVQAVSPSDGIGQQFDRRRLARGEQLGSGHAVWQSPGGGAGGDASG